jgi:hypothetical protein
MRRLAASAGLLTGLTACSAWVDVGGRSFAQDAAPPPTPDAATPPAPDAAPSPPSTPDGRVGPPTPRPDAAAEPPPDIAFQPPPRDAMPVPTPDAAPVPDAAPPPDAALPTPCETCASGACAEALARCEADPACVETRVCVATCDREPACRRACDDRVSRPTWFRYISLEACLEARCGLPNECGPQGWGCGLTDAYRYDRGEGACWTCMQRDCCQVGLDCARSVQCLQRVACLIGCFIDAPGCPGDAACRALPEAALSDGWIDCVGGCSPECP